MCMDTENRLCKRGTLLPVQLSFTGLIVGGKRLWWTESAYKNPSSACDQFVHKQHPKGIQRCDNNNKPRVCGKKKVGCMSHRFFYGIHEKVKSCSVPHINFLMVEASPLYHYVRGVNPSHPLKPYRGEAVPSRELCSRRLERDGKGGLTGRVMLGPTQRNLERF